MGLCDVDDCSPGLPQRRLRAVPGQELLEARRMIADSDSTSAAAIALTLVGLLSGQRDEAAIGRCAYFVAKVVRGLRAPALSGFGPSLTPPAGCWTAYCNAPVTTHGTVPPHRAAQRSRTSSNAAGALGGHLQCRTVEERAVACVCPQRLQGGPLPRRSPVATPG